MTTQVSISPYGIQFFLNNQGEPNVGGSVLTQVGGINYATYQDSAGTIPLPNPIPLNARGEISNSSGVSCQLFLVSGVTYTFTLYDAAGNQLNQAAYVTPPAIATQTSPFTESTIAVSQSVALVDSGTVFICTAALTLTVAQTSLLNKSWFVTVYAYGGDITVTPYSTDKINGGTAGASITIPQGYIANIYTDGQGNLYCNVGTSVANATNAVNLTGSGTVSATTTGGAGLTPTNATNATNAINLTGSGTISSTTTGTTQAIGDNSARLSTTAYADTHVPKDAGNVGVGAFCLGANSSTTSVAAGGTQSGSIIASYIYGPFGSPLVSSSNSTLSAGTWRNVGNTSSYYDGSSNYYYTMWQRIA